MVILSLTCIKVNYCFIFTAETGDSEFFGHIPRWEHTFRDVIRVPDKKKSQNFHREREGTETQKHFNIVLGYRKICNMPRNCTDLMPLSTCSTQPSCPSSMETRGVRYPLEITFPFSANFLQDRIFEIKNQISSPVTDNYFLIIWRYCDVAADL